MSSVALSRNHDKSKNAHFSVWGPKEGPHSSSLPQIQKTATSFTMKCIWAQASNPRDCLFHCICNSGNLPASPAAISIAHFWHKFHIHSGKPHCILPLNSSTCGISLSSKTDYCTFSCSALGLLLLEHVNSQQWVTLPLPDYGKSLLTLKVKCKRMELKFGWNVTEEFYFLSCFQKTLCPEQSSLPNSMCFGPVINTVCLISVLFLLSSPRQMHHKMDSVLLILRACIVRRQPKSNKTKTHGQGTVLQSPWGHNSTAFSMFGHLIFFKDQVMLLSFAYLKCLFPESRGSWIPDYFEGFRPSKHWSKRKILQRP